jgi:hypothetical protein
MKKLIVYWMSLLLVALPSLSASASAGTYPAAGRHAELSNLPRIYRQTDRIGSREVVIPPKFMLNALEEQQLCWKKQRAGGEWPVGQQRKAHFCIGLRIRTDSFAVNF